MPKWLITLAFLGCDPGLLSGGSGPIIVLTPPRDGAVEAAEDAQPADGASPFGPERDGASPAPRDAAAPEPDAQRRPPPRDAAPPPPDAGPPEHCADGPLAAPIPGCRPPSPPSTGDPAQDCVDRINQFRAECQCLPPLRRWVEGEACADEHAAYDAERRSPHAGFSGRICPESGFGQNECPGYGGVRDVIENCLQQMWDEGPGEDFQRHGHYLNMTSARFSMVACGFFDSPQTGMWAVQNFQ